MKTLLLSLATAAALILPAPAETYNLPEENPLAIITVPDVWDTDQTEEGIEATSKDGEAYFYVETTDANNVEEGMKYLAKNGVTVDAETVKQQEGKFNGMDVVDVSWDGTDKDGDAKVSLTVVAITKDKGVLLVYWASPEGEKANAAALKKIAQSIKKA
jgi:hypothetical protein